MEANQPAGNPQPGQLRLQRYMPAGEKGFEGNGGMRVDGTIPNVGGFRGPIFSTSNH